MLTVPAWQVLRILVRVKNRPQSGARLRHTPTRATKDGSFLGELIEAGLLKVVARSRPGDPFADTYKLTELGKHAAQYREFDKAEPPWKSV